MNLQRRKICAGLNKERRNLECGEKSEMCLHEKQWHILAGGRKTVYNLHCIKEIVTIIM